MKRSIKKLCCSVVVAVVVSPGAGFLTGGCSNSFAGDGGSGQDGVAGSYGGHSGYQVGGGNWNQGGSGLPSGNGQLHGGYGSVNGHGSGLPVPFGTGGIGAAYGFSGISPYYGVGPSSLSIYSNYGAAFYGSYNYLGVPPYSSPYSNRLDGRGNSSLYRSGIYATPYGYSGYSNSPYPYNPDPYAIYSRDPMLGQQKPSSGASTVYAVPPTATRNATAQSPSSQRVNPAQSTEPGALRPGMVLPDGSVVVSVGPLTAPSASKAPGESTSAKPTTDTLPNPSSVENGAKTGTRKF